MDDDLAVRLEAVGVDPAQIDDPSEAWRLLEERFGTGATVFDRYAIQAGHRGVAQEDLSTSDRQQAGEEFLAARFPGIELIGGPSGAPIEVVDYDDAWFDVFLVWRQRISDAVGSAAKRIEHVGSTAVPGLAAKPVVDIQVSVEDIEDESRYVHAIESTGVPLRSRDREHRYFRPPKDQPRVVQIHVCDIGSNWQRGHLLFRDFLRADPSSCRAYAALKRRLAAEYHNDRLAYTEAKSEFILGTLARAEGWATETGWIVGNSVG